MGDITDVQLDTAYRQRIRDHLWSWVTNPDAVGAEDWVEVLTSLREVCKLRQARNEEFAEAVANGRLCEECPCNELDTGECPAKMEESQT